MSYIPYYCKVITCWLLNSRLATTVLYLVKIVLAAQMLQLAAVNAKNCVILLLMPSPTVNKIYMQK